MTAAQGHLVTELDGRPALTALLQGRGEAYAHDAATLVVIAARDPNLRLVGEAFAVSDAAVGIRKQ